jgi:aryl-alcohol dehydrogenase-like predicted oxidoreductase
VETGENPRAAAEHRQGAILRLLVAPKLALGSFALGWRCQFVGHRCSSSSREKDVTVSQLALAWTVQQPGITSSIIGPRTLAQLQDNLRALDVTLSPRSWRASTPSVRLAR